MMNILVMFAGMLLFVTVLMTMDYLARRRHRRTDKHSHARGAPS